MAHVREGRHVFEDLTVEENLIAAAQCADAARQRRRPTPSWSSTTSRACSERRKQLAGYLSGGEQQMLAIGRALIGQPQLILLDEPSLGLAPLVVQDIFAIIARINREQGVAMLLVEQNARIALGVATTATSWRTAASSSTARPSTLLADPDVQRFYLGGGEQGEARRELPRRQALQAPQAVAVVSQQRCRMTARRNDSAELPLPQQLLHWARALPDEVALRQKEFGIWQPITWAQYARASRGFGLGLLAARPRGRATRSPSCARTAANGCSPQLGAALVGGITVGVYPTSPAAEVDYLLALSEAPIVVCEDQEQVDKVLAIRERLPHLRAIIVIDPRGLRHYDRASARTTSTRSRRSGRRLERRRSRSCWRAPGAAAARRHRPDGLHLRAPPAGRRRR